MRINIGSRGYIDVGIGGSLMFPSLHHSQKQLSQNTEKEIFSLAHLTLKKKLQVLSTSTWRDSINSNCVEIMIKIYLDSSRDICSFRFRAYFILNKIYDGIPSWEYQVPELLTPELQAELEATPTLEQVRSYPEF